MVIPNPRPPAGRQTCALATALAAMALLSGCASFSPDGGFGPVQQSAQQHLGKDLLWLRSADAQDPVQARIHERVATLLAQPLDADAAVQIALLNNRGLQASFQDLGITEAEVVQAGRLPNPGISFGRLTRGGEVEIERGLHINLARLLVLPLSGPLQARRLQQTQNAVAMNVLSLAADTRKAWVMALAAQETAHYMRQVQQAADSGADLARRMQQAGNFNKLQRAREQGFAADARLNLVRAEHAQRAARERLTRLMGLSLSMSPGLSGEQALYRLPERLPDLPGSLAEPRDIEARALAQRLDVQAARLQVQQTAADLGLTRSTRFINVLELGVGRNTSNEAAPQRAWELRLELPLFDWSGARVARSEAVYMQALHRAADTAINAASEVRDAASAWRSSYDIARHHQDEVVPLRKQIAEENLLRYNGMLIGVFELLADVRVQIGSVNAAIEARRDFWLAQADLDQALIGKPAFSPGAAGMPLNKTAAEAGGAGH